MKNNQKCVISYALIQKFAWCDFMSMVSSVTGTLKVRDILHLELKRAERLDHVAEDEQQVAHAQGAEQRVEQTFHHPEWEGDVDAQDLAGGDIYADVDVVVEVYRLMAIQWSSLCRKAEDTEDVADKPNCAKDDHEDSNDPEPGATCE